MKRRIFSPPKMVLFFVMLFALFTTAFAYVVPDDTIVYVTPTGEKYHREDCSYTTTVRSMTIKAAERKGYDPCSRCNPDVLTGEYHSDWDGKGGGSKGGSGDNQQNNAESEPVKEITEAKKEPSTGSIIAKWIGRLIIVLYLWIFLVGPLWFCVFIPAVHLIKNFFRRK